MIHMKFLVSSWFRNEEREVDFAHFIYKINFMNIIFSTELINYRKNYPDIGQEVIMFNML